jgi:hypothetical protein
VTDHAHWFLTDKGRRTAISWGRKRRKEILTWGAIPVDGDGFVYVGVSPDGRVKVGMTSHLERRGKELGIEMRYWAAVVPQAAREVETEALQILGHVQGDGEWLRKQSLQDAIRAIDEAMERLRRRLWVDPHLTEDEARKLRVKLAIDDAAARAILETPDRRNRVISITSHRKAMGSRGCVGARY